MLSPLSPAGKIRVSLLKDDPNSVPLAPAGHMNSKSKYMKKQNYKTAVVLWLNLNENYLVMAPMYLNVERCSHFNVTQR
jgi:hypothetical protein